ncbi:DciA family protein [Streptomyces angustmyceticus]|uniref:DciA family protein n=1 Tax=Streptomyces angustmyceticus TaxID=285578 RepID=UPI003450ED17
MDYPPHRPATEAQLFGSGADMALTALRIARADARRNRNQPPGRMPRSRRAGRSEAVSLGAAISELLAKNNWLASVDDNLVSQWPSMIGDLAKGLTAIAFDPATGALALRPASTAWATQARLLVPQIIRQVNKHLERETVQTIRLLPPGTEGTTKGNRSTTAALEQQKQANYPNSTRAGLLADPDLQAALERQARQTPREAEDLFAYHHAESRAPRTVHTRALARARALARRREAA